MRIAAGILGILGGLAGIFGSLIPLFVGGIDQAVRSTVDAMNAGLVSGGLWGIFLGILGIVGGGLAFAKPKAAALTMLVAGIGGLIAAGGFYIVGGPCLLLATVLSWIAGRRQVHVPTQTGTGVSA